MAAELESAEFLSYYPLKQGLKHLAISFSLFFFLAFLSYYPLKQGLKLRSDSYDATRGRTFLSYYPLKQGLKRLKFCLCHLSPLYFYPTIH